MSRITRAQIMAAFARDLERGIELPSHAEVLAIRALSQACAKLAVKNRMTWDDNGLVVRYDEQGRRLERK